MPGTMPPSIESNPDERTRLFVPVSPPDGPPPPSPAASPDRDARNHARDVLLSTTLSRFGSRSWEFAGPLLLLEWSPGSLAAPAAFGLTVSLSLALVAPWLGGRADNWDRYSTVLAGAWMQATGCAASVGALVLWNAVSGGDGDGNALGRLLSLALVIAAGVVEALGAQLVSVAVKKEWVPIVFDENNNDECKERSDDDDDETGAGKKSSSLLCLDLNFPVTLSFVNTTMTNIDLTAAMFGPILSGWILQVMGGDGSPGATTHSMQRGFVVVALMNVISFVPEALLLRRVYSSCSALRQRRGVCNGAAPIESETKGTSPDESDKPTANPWSVWFHHPSGLPLLTVSLASLYLTALSPAGVVLTAYLMTIGMSPRAIGVFRAVGALSGVAGIGLFSLARHWGEDDAGFEAEDEDAARSSSAKSIERLRRVSLAFLLSEVASVLVAAVAFSQFDVFDLSTREDSALSWQILLFLGAICASRAGLYSFDIGALEIEQCIVDERYRNAVGSVEGALCSLVEMGMYLISIALPDPSQFGWQVGVSATAVSFSGVCFGSFLCRYLMHGHHHHYEEELDDPHCHNHSHSHHHPHTFQQERELRQYNGYHIHLHQHKSFEFCLEHVAHDHRPCHMP